MSRWWWLPYSDFFSWVQYLAATVCSQDPTRIDDLLACMVIMIHDWRHYTCKYQGWLTYDEISSQSVVKLKSTAWTKLNGVTFMSVTCQTCSSPDYYTCQCTLYDHRLGPHYQSDLLPKRKRVQRREWVWGYVTHGTIDNVHDGTMEGVYLV